MKYSPNFERVEQVQFAQPSDQHSRQMSPVRPFLLLPLFSPPMMESDNLPSNHGAVGEQRASAIHRRICLGDNFDVLCSQSGAMPDKQRNSLYKDYTTGEGGEDDKRMRCHRDIDRRLLKCFIGPFSCVFWGNISTCQRSCFGDKSMPKKTYKPWFPSIYWANSSSTALHTALISLHESPLCSPVVPKISITFSLPSIDVPDFTKIFQKKSWFRLGQKCAQREIRGSLLIPLISYIASAEELFPPARHCYHSVAAIKNPFCRVGA